MKLNWKKIDKAVDFLAILAAGGFMVFGVETDNLRWFAFGILGIILMVNHNNSALHSNKKQEKKE